MGTWASVILAAGQGKRMRSATPKVIHPVAGKAMLLHVVEAVRHAHNGPLVVVVPPQSQAIATAVGEGTPLAVQSEPRGTGDALRCAAAALAGQVQHILVAGADSPLIQGETLRQMVERHSELAATVTILTSTLCPPQGLGRVLRDASGEITSIVEEKEAGATTMAVAEINSGIYCFDASWLWPALERLRPGPSGEVYLTELVAMARQESRGVASIQSQEPLEVLGVNDRAQLAQAEKAMQQRLRQRWMLAGVTMLDPDTTFLEAHVQLGQDTVIYPGTSILGRTAVGTQCRLGPNTVIADCVVGPRCHIEGSVLRGSTLEKEVHVGPFSHIRAGSHLEAGVYIGTNAEVKNSRLGRGTHVGHFSYVGDATVGAGVNIGAGTVTCNYDGVTKHRTIIEEGAFIGSDSMLVAPVRVGARAKTGAGSVVTHDVPPDTTVAGVPARRLLPKPAVRRGGGKNRAADVK